MTKQIALEEEAIPKLMWQYCIPAIVGMLVQTFYNIIDRIFVGHIPKVGNLALTGVGVTLPMMTFILGMSLLFGTGTRSLVSLWLGSNKKQQAEKMLGTMVTSAFVTSLFIMAAGLISLKPLLYLFGANDQTYPYAKDFMRIIFLSTPINMVGFTLNKVISADGNPKIAMYSQFLGAGLNILLDPIFIFGLQLGVSGAAVATSLSQTVVLIWVLHYFTRNPKRTMTLYWRNLAWKFPLFRRMTSIGLSAFFIQLATSVVQMISNQELHHYGGELSIGAMTIIQSISLVFIQPVIGLNQGIQPIIGYNYAKGLHSRVRLVMKLAIQIGTVWVTLGWLLILGVPQVIIQLFTNSMAMEQIAIVGVRLFLGMLCVDGFQLIVSNYYQAIGNVKRSIFLSVLRQWVLLIPLMLLLPHFLGVNGIWISGSISDFIAFIVTFFFFKKTRCEYNNVE